jgi:hypothetical protein
MPKHTLPGTDRLPSIGPNFSVPRATPDTFSGFRLALETRTPLLVAVTLYFRARKRLRIEWFTGIARRVSSIYSRGAVNADFVRSAIISLSCSATAVLGCNGLDRSVGSTKYPKYGLSMPLCAGRREQPRIQLLRCRSISAPILICSQSKSFRIASLG